MNVFLTSLGCRLNEAEVDSWARQFRSAGHHVVPSPDDAQVVVVNTCAVTSEAGRKSRKLVSGLHRRNPSAHVVVTGCFAELEPERTAGLLGVDMVVSNRDKDTLVARVSQGIDVSTMPVLSAQADGAHAFRESRTRAFVKVQDGCRNKCTFCVVTVARGEERSRTIEEITAEVCALEQDGCREVVLCGVHLGGYGADLGLDLRTLVDRLLRGCAIDRVRLSSLEPWDLPPDFAELWREPRLLPHLHLPLQSGSNSVLRRMARRCMTSAYRRLVDDLRARVPDLHITTDLIVGFPGETDEEWRDTVAFVRDIGFAHVHIFPFSPREGTRAAELAGRVPGNVIKDRCRAMHDVAAQMKAEHLDRAVGQRRQVLWERCDQGMLSGYTDTYLRVEMAGAAEAVNTIETVDITGVLGEPAERLLAQPALAKAVG